MSFAVPAHYVCGKVPLRFASSTNITSDGHVLWERPHTSHEPLPLRLQISPALVKGQQDLCPGDLEDLGMLRGLTLGKHKQSPKLVFKTFFF